MRDFIQRLVKEVLRSNIKIVKFTGLQNAEEEKCVYEEWGFEESGVVDRDAMAKKWECGFQPNSGGGSIDDEIWDPYNRRRCMLCYKTDASDEPSVPTV